MKYAELVKKLKRLECEYVRQAGGSHEIWLNRRTGKSAPIPYHRTKDIGPQLMSRILRELEIDRNEFDRA
ncbi:MAG: type II toxin-antitoxin system HicA family toxin [Chloroflexi bacterium]|nr:type II toxin-antitoxin system HicA family toxin [Chloroflexota bacterium]